MARSTIFLYLCITFYQVSYGHPLDKRTKQNEFQEKIVQLNRFSLAIDDNTEGHPCPIGMYFNEATQECKCSDNSIYIADNAQCQCIEGYKEMTLFRSYIRCYKYTDTRASPPNPGVNH